LKITFGGLGLFKFIFGKNNNAFFSPIKPVLLKIATAFRPWPYKNSGIGFSQNPFEVVRI